MFLAVLSGLLLTIVVTVGAFVLGSALAIPLVLLLRSKLLVLRLIARMIVDLLRGIPPIVWLFVLYFGISVGSVKLTALQAGIVGLGLISAGYIAEICRGGLLGVNKGQWEAGHALGLSNRDLLVSIISPQALRVAFPSLVTYLVGLLKDSSIASTIGVAEMVFQSTSYARQSGTGVTAFFVAAAIYILMSVPLGWFSRSMDKKLQSAVVK